MMNRVFAVLTAFVLCSPCPLYADYGVEDRGTWPMSWPKELEGLRERSRAFEGPMALLLHYSIPFTKREEFEAVWPHLLKVKTKGAPIVLTRGSNFWLGEGAQAGVCIHTPPNGETPLADAKEAGGNWRHTTYIELIVDGEIVDLNRIRLPPDTPIVDKRFQGDAPTMP